METGQHPDPQPSDDVVVVQIKATAICGSDRHANEPPGEKLFILGHEGAGVVVAVDKPARIRVGDRVSIRGLIGCDKCRHCCAGDVMLCPHLCVPGRDINGCDAEYIAVPERACIVMPDEMSFEEGALLGDALGTPFHALEVAERQPRDVIGIFGLGPIGLGALMIAKYLGHQVVGVGMKNPYRLKFARQLGADVVIDANAGPVAEAVREATSGLGADIALETGGVEPAFHAALDSVKHKGMVVLVGACRQVAFNPWTQVQARELTLRGAWNYNTRELPGMLNLIRDGLDIKRLTTHRFSLADGPHAFALFASGNSGKIVMHP